MPLTPQREWHFSSIPSFRKNWPGKSQMLPNPPLDPRNSDLMLPLKRVSPVLISAALFLFLTLGLSWWRWWTFQYRSFDLAFYVQTLWLALRGESHGSLLGISLMGNHAEPIVYLLLPVFALIPHPMLLVGIQNLALASMPFTAWRITKQMLIPSSAGLCLALSTLAAPATGFIALHEFHPEAFAAPLILLLAEARLTKRHRLFWFWFVLAMATKENVALALVGWCAVHAFLDRNTTRDWQWRWNLGPLLCAGLWVGVYVAWLSPWLNGGRVDYGQLYVHLGNSLGDIILKLVTEPHRIVSALWQGLTGGNLVWGLLLSFVALPLLRPRFLVIASPLFLQHLLSSRPSEWTLFFHYAAPILPLLWLGAADVVRAHPSFRVLGFAPLVSCIGMQIMFGPLREFFDEGRQFSSRLSERTWKAEQMKGIASNGNLSVVAGFPYLSHLANRRDLHSLHFTLKGLRTLSMVEYAPPSPDAVILDYSDDSTFNRPSAFYHPASPNVGGRRLASSDELLSAFLRPVSWTVSSMNSVTLLARRTPAEPIAASAHGVKVNASSTLHSVRISPDEVSNRILVNMVWSFSVPRDRIPWLYIRLADAKYAAVIPVGMCSPEVGAGSVEETRVLTLPPSLAPGCYSVTAFFMDQIESLWSRADHPAALYATELETICIRKAESN